MAASTASWTGWCWETTVTNSEADIPALVQLWAGSALDGGAIHAAIYPDAESEDDGMTLRMTAAEARRLAMSLMACVAALDSTVAEARLFVAHSDEDRLKRLVVDQ